MQAADWQLRVLRELDALDAGLTPPGPRPAPLAAPVPTRADPARTPTHAFGVPTPTAEPDVDPAPPPRSPAPAEANGVYTPQDFARRNPHGDTRVRRVTQGVRRNMGGSAILDASGASELAESVSPPVPSCRRIAVTSIRGGAGKSTIAALVAALVHRHRGDRVVAVDADPGLGSLALRLGTRHTGSLRDLAATRPRTWDEVSTHLTRTHDGLWVLTGTPCGRVGDDLDHPTFAAGVGRLSRYCSVAVIDCGAGLVTPLHRGILDDAHAQIFVAPGTGDGAVSALAALDWFRANGYEHLLARTVIALTSSTQEGDIDLNRAGEALREGGTPVVTVPYDRHLAAGITLDRARVSAAAHHAVTRIARTAFAHSLEATS